MLFVNGYPTEMDWREQPDWMAFLAKLEADPDRNTSMLPPEKSHLLAHKI